MNRKEFIQRFTALGLGAAIFPTLAVSCKEEPSFIEGLDVNQFAQYERLVSDRDISDKLNCDLLTFEDCQLLFFDDLSQTFEFGDNVALDPRPTRWGYTVFGRVIDGMDTIDQIGYVATGPGPAPELVKDVPAEPIVIKSMTVVAKTPAAEDAPMEATE